MLNEIRILTKRAERSERGKKAAKTGSFYGLLMEETVESYPMFSSLKNVPTSERSMKDPTATTNNPSAAL